MTTLGKVSGKAEKVRHKVYRGNHTVTFYLGLNQIRVQHSLPIPVENGDEICVVGEDIGSGTMQSMVFNNISRKVSIHGELKSAYGCLSVIVIALILITILGFNTEIATVLLPILVLSFLSIKGIFRVQVLKKALDMM